MAQLAGKIALVTGGTSGIGETTARAMAREGATVVLTGRREAEGARVEQAIRDEGGDALFLVTDVNDEDAVAGVMDTISSRFGRLDIAFNNAGVIERPLAPLQSRTASDFDHVFGANVRGLFFCLKHELVLMERQRSGVIVNNASVGGMGGVPGIALYIASKHAVIGLTKAVALEAASLGIRVNAIAPYATVTGIVSDESAALMRATVPMDRLGEADEQARVVVFLASEAASFMTGAVLPVDGGLSAFLFGTGITTAS